MAERKFFTTLQEQMESGGRQLDKSGKPLVGRYRDGTTPSPAKRAYGAGQMQIATAKAVAAKHGWTFDEQKFLYDKETNLKYADTHMADLNTKYGDMTLARGAYHSGEGAVDKAIAKYGRAGFARGLGPEGRKYVGMGKGASGGGAMTPITVDDITQVGATGAEKQALAQPYDGVANPFNNAGVVKAVDRVQQRTSLADAILQQAIGESKDIRTQQLQEIDSTVAAKRKLYEHGEETTNALIQAATPIFEQRKQIQERRKEIASSNPFVAMVKGVIDPDYNSDSLESRDNMLKGDLALLDEEYTHQNNLHEKLIGIVTAKSQDQNVLYNAQLTNLGEDVRLAVQSYEMGGALLDAEMKGFQTDSALVAAQTTQRNNFLSTATTGQINEMLLQADASDSKTVEVKGMPFSSSMLQEEQNRRQEQGYHMANLKYALMNQNEAVTQLAQKKALETMNLDQVRKGLDNNGVIDGVQFDQVELGKRAEQLRQVSQGQAQDAVMSTVGGQWGALVNNYAGSTHGYALRLGSMFGAVPDQFNVEFKQQSNRLVAISQQIKELSRSGQKDAARQLLASTMPEVQEMFTRRDKMVDEMVTRWSGGNSDLKAIGISWAQGTQVEPGAALRGLVYMARNGPPAGMRFQGTAAKVFNTVREATRSWDNKQVGDDKLKGTAGDRDTALIQQIQSRLGAVFNSDMLTQTLASAPDTAKHIMVNGKRHPFSMVSREAMATAIDQGDERGYQIAGQSIGISDPATIKKIIAEGPKGQTWIELQKGLPEDKKNFASLVEALKAGQTQGMYQVLDTFRTDGMPAAPSTMLKDLMNRPEFAQSAQNQGLIQERGTMGGFVASAASAGGFGNEVSNLVNRANASHTAYRAQKINSMAVKAQALTQQPVARAAFLIKSIPGLNDDEEATLLTALKGTMYQPSSTELAMAQGERGQTFHDSNSYITKKQWQSIEGTILNGKFEDPRVEALRKKVAPVWKQYHESTEKLIGSSWFGGN